MIPAQSPPIWRRNLKKVKLLLEHQTHNEGDLFAAEKRLTDLRSVFGKLLYIGTLTSLTILFRTLQATIICNKQRLQLMNVLNAVLSALKKCSCIVSYRSCKGLPLELETMPDASMQTKNGKTTVREGIIVLRRSLATAHAIGWTSKLAGKVARGTGTVKLLAAADAVNKLTFFKHLFEEIVDSQTTELVLDSRPAFHLWSTMKKPEEVKNKLLLDPIPEMF